MYIQKAKARIALEDGTVFRGYSFAANGTSCGEIVFNTSLCGYQEIITDPSYKGQIVTMTYPLIGNYGTNLEDVESQRPFVEGFIVRECSPIASNWRSKELLSGYLRKNNVIAIEGIDTRALTKHIRIQGAMRAAISTEEFSDSVLVEKARSSEMLVGRDLVREVIPDTIMHHNRQGKIKVLILDCGVKMNIIRELIKNDCCVITAPATTSLETIKQLKPQGVMLSNGPGDPAAVTYVIETVRALLGRLPLFGICLGHQMLGLALGAKTFKLKFGHHGGNHPVKDLRTGKIEITVQNHGFCIDPATFSNDEVEVTHLNLNDNTLEGIRHKKLPLFSVQFHPEAGPGPHDAQHLFGRFIRMIKSA